ncbi:dTMP kinase [Corynebacterium urealyticum]|uniref:Thymidylate kinase n=1 Tax=Corynebacterium urealyticum TaxID=43771 RepID=A0A5D4FLW3_9CORY|nr:dTMP kinase [Corynebacterium urealyticum]TYR17018.1 dTMP kinase [Corynebacterium urealyticum]
MIIAFEGIDGAGKNTLVTALEAELLARELPVARVSFPRYEDSVHAQLAQRALTGQMGDLIDSVHGMATLFALDRAEVAEQLEDLNADGYIVLMDRFVASNAAYSAARLADETAEGEEPVEPAEHPVVEWVRSLEVDDLGSPVPDLQVLVDASAEVAGERAKSREQQDAARTRDAYESDGGLQQRTLEAYHSLASAEWLGPWQVVASEAGGVSERASQLADRIEGEYRELEH